LTDATGPDGLADSFGQLAVQRDRGSAMQCDHQFTRTEPIDLWHRIPFCDRRGA
jgi:hypothetical protein